MLGLPRFHRAGPSTSLDKSTIQGCIVIKRDNTMMEIECQLHYIGRDLEAVNRSPPPAQEPVPGRHDHPSDNTQFTSHRRDLGAVFFLNISQTSPGGFAIIFSTLHFLRGYNSSNFTLIIFSDLVLCQG